LKHTWFIDADGTLWHHSPVREALLLLAEHLGLQGLGEYYELHRALLKEGRYLDAYDWHTIAIRVAERHGLPRGATLRIFEHGIEEGLGGITLLPGVKDTLEEAVEAGVQLVIVSNGLSKYIEPPLAETGLSRYFTSVVTPDRVRIYWAPVIKPHRPIFAEAAKRAPAHHYTMIGDTYTDDILGSLLWGADQAFLLGDGRVRQPAENPCAITLDGYAAKWVEAVESCHIALGVYTRVEGWREIKKYIPEE